MKKTKQHSVVMLSTGTPLKANQLFLHPNCLLCIAKCNEDELTNHKPQHLYFLSDETPKQGDKVIHKNLILTVSVNRGLYLTVEEFSSVDVRTDICKKIVATTDKSLLPKKANDPNLMYEDLGNEMKKIPESFVKAYVNAFNNGKPITDVELEMERSVNYLPKVSELESKIYDSYTIKTRPDNTIIVHQSKLYTKDDIRTVMILKLESMMPEVKEKFGKIFTGTNIYDAIEFGEEKILLGEIKVYKRAIKEIDKFLDENL